MKRPKRDPVHEDRIHNEAIGRCASRRTGNELVLLSGRQDQLPIPGQVCGHEGRLTNPEGRNRRGLTDGRRGCLRARHARAIPLAGAENARFSFATRGNKPGRIHPRSHQRLALLGGAGLLSLTYTRLPKPHVHRRYRDLLQTAPYFAAKACLLNLLFKGSGEYVVRVGLDKINLAGIVYRHDISVSRAG